LIPTGLYKLDELLGGGIRNSIITDIFGASGTGKTQLALQLCVNALRNNAVILYQDTTGNFRPERLLEFVKLNNMNLNLLDNVKVGRIINTAEQIKYLEKIYEIKNLNLIIIDNITDLFSFEYTKESKSLTKHIEFMKYMHNLSSLAIKKKIPIVVTNMVRKSDEKERENMDRSISMFVHQKIHLVKLGSRYTAEVLPAFGIKKEISYTITSAGIVDYS
jgi:DNA repair protein RAD51